MRLILNSATRSVLLRERNKKEQEKRGKRKKRSGGYPRGFAHHGHVCIIRDKPITARNACQAVKRYPGPQPGGLMISLGKLDHLLPSSPPSPPSPPLPLLFTSSSSIHRARRIITALIVTRSLATTSSACDATMLPFARGWLPRWSSGTCFVSGHEIVSEYSRGTFRPAFVGEIVSKWRKMLDDWSRSDVKLMEK